MTVRSFNPWATPRRPTNPSPQHQLTIRRGDDYQTITIRQAGHDDWDTICDHWDTITAIADSEPDLPAVIASGIGPERGGSRSMADMADGETARNTLLERNAAIAWLREDEQLRAAITRHAQRASIVDVPPVAAKGKPELERCVKCQQDIDPEADDGKAKRVNGHPLHRNTCYHQVWRQAHTQQVDMVIIVNLLAAGIHT